MSYEQKFWASLAIANLWAISGNTYVAWIWCAMAGLFMFLQHRN